MKNIALTLPDAEAYDAMRKLRALRDSQSEDKELQPKIEIADGVDMFGPVRPSEPLVIGAGPIGHLTALGARRDDIIHIVTLGTGLEKEIIRGAKRVLGEDKVNIIELSAIREEAEKQLKDANEAGGRILLLVDEDADEAISQRREFIHLFAASLHAQQMPPIAKSLVIEAEKLQLQIISEKEQYKEPFNTNPQKPFVPKHQQPRGYHKGRW